MKQMDIYNLLAATKSSIEESIVNGKKGNKEVDCYLTILYMASNSFANTSHMNTFITSHLLYFENLLEQSVEDYIKFSKETEIQAMQKCLIKINQLEEILYKLNKLTKGE